MTQERGSVLTPSRTTDRRREVRGTEDEPTRRALVSMIIGTYREMPGLSLHLNQAVRLFGVEKDTCHAVLDYLVRLGDLRQTDDGRYRVR